MSDERERKDEAERNEDSESILSRREFLIKSALLSAGVMGASACAETRHGTIQGADTLDTQVGQDAPQVCLSRPPEDIAMSSDGTMDSLSDTATSADVPQVCLTPLPPDVQDATQPDLLLIDAPQPCLSIIPPDMQAEDDKADAPQVCLSPPLPDTEG